MNPTSENASLIPQQEPAPRDVEEVPYVELHGGRLQGVVSSGSDINRVYVAFLEAGTGDYYSVTNNNRPDAGMAKRLRWLMEQAVAQFGAERVARYLQVPGDPASYTDGTKILQQLARGRQKKEEAGAIFSRFLNYLRFVELDCADEPIPEMDWFTVGD
jgi:hypothetical protein